MGRSYLHPQIVVVAQALDRKAFYVALSRGRKHMALHCPEKEFLKQQLSFRIGDRMSVHDLVRDGRILPLSQDATNRKAETLPDTTYKSIAERVRRFMDGIKKMAAKMLGFQRKRTARKARNRKYGFGIVTPEMRLGIEHQSVLEALEEQRRKEARSAEIDRMLHSERKFSAYEEAMQKVHAQEGRTQVKTTVAPSYDTLPPLYPSPESIPFTPLPSIPPHPSVRRLSVYEEIQELMKNFTARLAEHQTLERAEQERLGREPAIREQAEHEAAAERARLEAERQKKEQARKIIEPSPSEKKKPDRGMDL